MSDTRFIDLDVAPDPRVEVRLSLGLGTDRAPLKVGMWMPADAEAFGLAMQALGRAGFDLVPSREA